LADVLSLGQRVLWIRHAELPSGQPTSRHERREVM
jgi:hypothetical protein